MAAFAGAKLSPAEEKDFERETQSISDLVLLDEITTAAITAELSARYRRGEMYTCIGPVLIAVNPSLAGVVVFPSPARRPARAPPGTRC